MLLYKMSLVFHFLCSSFQQVFKEWQDHKAVYD